MIRPEVAHVAAFPPLPPEDECSEQLIEELDAATRALPRPLTDEEAVVLLDVLATLDDYYGIMWTILHAGESAPGVPPQIWTREGRWFERLRNAAINAGFAPQA